MNYYGKYRASVIDTLDPEGRARVRALVPEVLGDESSGWALPCASATELIAGLRLVPPLGSHIWIEFEGGDLARPIWSGGYWPS